MKYQFRRHYPKIENKVFNERVFRDASQVIDLCASIEDVMCEMIVASHENDLCPVYIDGDVKTEVLKSVAEINQLCSKMVSNDETPTIYNDTDAAFKAWLNRMYGKNSPLV